MFKVVQQTFHSPRAQFCARCFKRALIVQQRVFPIQEGARLAFPLIPAFGQSDDTRQTFSDNFDYFNQNFFLSLKPSNPISDHPQWPISRRPCGASC